MTKIVLCCVYCIDLQFKKNRQKTIKTEKVNIRIYLVNTLIIFSTLQRFIVRRRTDRKVPRGKRSLLEAPKSHLIIIINNNNKMLLIIINNQRQKDTFCLRQRVNFMKGGY